MNGVFAAAIAIYNPDSDISTLEPVNASMLFTLLLVANILYMLAETLAHLALLALLGSIFCDMRIAYHLLMTVVGIWGLTSSIIVGICWKFRTGETGGGVNIYHFLLAHACIELFFSILPTALYLPAIYKLNMKRWKRWKLFGLWSLPTLLIIMVFIWRLVTLARLSTPGTYLFDDSEIVSSSVVECSILTVYTCAHSVYSVFKVAFKSLKEAFLNGSQQGDIEQGNCYSVSFGKDAPENSCGTPSMRSTV
ncbi:hypothetical protein B0I35DRAFT_485074 [Stachybotrys elegans]|uniref:Rhodopsin domain-containing protein n=1 Tax=Stachybotrys elegans TaxID=80388 RepID=A0A8K0SGS4_9HYPO|nr:hypothetical protein B0I35DRAFT_485074 [Stachybotrys elegans]